MDEYDYKYFYQSSGNLVIPAYVNREGIIYPVTDIAENAFSMPEYNVYATINSILIPNTVKAIGNSAFECCRNLTSLTIGSGVTSIGDWAFDECSGLTSITIPSSVTSIGKGAFSYCSSLTSITIPNSVTDIGGSAFAYCTSLTSIAVENGNSVYDSRNNCNAIIETATNTLITGCKNTVIPNTVTKIGDDAFAYCSFTSITIPSSVTSIRKWAFCDCSSLTTVNYTGTEEQWNALLENIGEDNDYLINAEINFNYTGA